MKPQGRSRPHPHLPAPSGPPFLPLTTSNPVALPTTPNSPLPPALATPHILPEWSDLSKDRTSQTKILSEATPEAKGNFMAAGISEERGEGLSMPALTLTLDRTQVCPPSSRSHHLLSSLLAESGVCDINTQSNSSWKARMC